METEGRKYKDEDPLWKQVPAWTTLMIPKGTGFMFFHNNLWSGNSVKTGASQVVLMDFCD